MTGRRTCRILIIEDNAELAEDAAREIRDAFQDDPDVATEVEIELDFDEALARAASGKFHVVVLDLKRDSSDPASSDELAGRGVFDNIRSAVFAPVVFWTALPEQIADEAMPPLVTVIAKDDTDKLPGAIRAAIDSGALSAIAEIELVVTSTLRDHMWSELAPNWSEYTAEGSPSAIAQVLISRLARVLDADLESSPTALPSHRYIYPPASAQRLPGDILRDSAGKWWVLLTPACDLANSKAEFILVAEAGQLTDHKKYVKWNDAPSKASWLELEKDVLAATQGRFRFLPKFRDIPDLVVDLERTEHWPAARLANETVVASLASPFAEALVVQHSQFRGRVGTPDLDVEAVRTRLTP